MVTRGTPFQFTAEVGTKFVPATVRVNELPPAVVEVGLTDASVGEGFVIVNIWLFEEPPERFHTVTLALPAARRSAAGTMAVNDDGET